ncbi:MAG: CopD family protein, partial [Gemmatimonadetes bacterium]|nr:CopD family protein [Gemmatimonadota bacterium]
GSAAIIGATGVFAAWLHLDAVSSMWTTPYGRRLSIKLAVLGVVLACGAYNWKRARERVHASGHAPKLPPTIAIELLAAALILLVTAVLVTTPPPAH